MVEQGIGEGLFLFNGGKYFEAHEALEAVWLRATERRKVFLQGLVQVAAAFHHYTHRNFAGFQSLLEKGCAKLEKFGAEAEGVDLEGLMLDLRRWREPLDPTSNPAAPAPPLPRIRLIGNSRMD